MLGLNLFYFFRTLHNVTPGFRLAPLTGPLIITPINTAHPICISTHFGFFIATAP